MYPKDTRGQEQKLWQARKQVSICVRKINKLFQYNEETAFAIWKILLTLISGRATVDMFNGGHVRPYIKMLCGSHILDLDLTVPTTCISDDMFSVQIFVSVY